MNSLCVRFFLFIPNVSKRGITTKVEHEKNCVFVWSICFFGKLCHEFTLRFQSAQPGSYIIQIDFTDIDIPKAPVLRTTPLTSFRTSIPAWVPSADGPSTRQFISCLTVFALLPLWSIRMSICSVPHQQQCLAINFGYHERIRGPVDGRVHKTEWKAGRHRPFCHLKICINQRFVCVWLNISDETFICPKGISFSLFFNLLFNWRWQNKMWSTCGTHRHSPERVWYLSGVDDCVCPCRSRHDVIRPRLRLARMARPFNQR